MEGNDEYEIESGTRSRSRGRSRTRNDDRQREREISRGSHSRPAPAFEELDEDERERKLLGEQKRLEERMQEIKKHLEENQRKKYEELLFRQRQERIALEESFGVRGATGRLVDESISNPVISAIPAPMHSGTISQAPELNGIFRKYEPLPDYPGQYTSFSAWKDAAIYVLISNFLYGYVLDYASVEYPVSMDLISRNRLSLITYGLIHKAIPHICYLSIQDPAKNPAIL